MSDFFLGIAATSAVLEGGKCLNPELGFLNLQALLHPSAFEKGQATSFMDVCTVRHAPGQENTILSTEPDLLDTMEHSRDHCATCHGAPDHPEKEFEHSFCPTAP
jgi:hypothetical protein